MRKGMFELWNRAVLPYIFVLALGYYVMAALFQFITAASSDAMFPMVIYCFYIALPIIALITGIVHGLRRRVFSVSMTVLAAALFLPVIVIMMNATAWLFPIMYAAAYAIGNALALIVAARRR